LLDKVVDETLANAVSRPLPSRVMANAVVTDPQVYPSVGCLGDNSNLTFTFVRKGVFAGVQDNFRREQA
jgi:hypothetical protein